MFDEITRPPLLRTLVATTRLTDRQRIIRILDRAGGYDVIAETGDGRSAVRLSGQIEPDLVLLDLDLPELGGIDATPAILHKAPGATIVILTPRGEDSGGVLAVRFGARAHVPLDSLPEILLAALEAALPREVAGRQAATGAPGTAPPSWWEALLADR
ncbi:MAG TPA: response regulator [Candidatus Dormibacteraeota bacterium]|jgi:DNA-binding NarL/FixJ family response regulator